MNRTYTGRINSLKPNEIFVFGSNTQGRHGKGAAKSAMKWGAKYGKASGPQGRTFAIITKDLTKRVHPSRSPEQIKQQIEKLYCYASGHPNLEFLVAYNAGGKNLNHYTSTQMAAFFAAFDIPENIIFEHEFYKMILSLD